MRAVYRTVSALLAIGSGVVLAMLITAVADGGDVEVVWFVVFAVVAVVAAVVAVVLWSRALAAKQTRRRP